MHPDPKDSDPAPRPPGPTAALPSLLLLTRMQDGDAAARDELVRRYWPRLERWARGRLPAGARDLYETSDLVQETMIAALGRLQDFEPRHDGALLAYLRTAVVNRIRTLAGRARRRGHAVELHSGLVDPGPSALEDAIGREAIDRFERALEQLRPEDRDAVHLKIELGLPYEEIASALGKPTITATRMAVSRALARLAAGDGALCLSAISWASSQRGWPWTSRSIGTPRSAPPRRKKRAAIRQLRLVAAMGGFYTAVPASAESEDLSESISLARSVAGSGEGAPESNAGKAPEAASASALPRGSRWGHLEILERVGSGAFGEVFRARDTRLDRVVALKLLTHEVSGPDGRVREARLLAKARHANVVVVHGADRIDNRVGIWMEFLEGETLDQILRVRGKLDAREAALIGIDLCRALSAVHATGTIHQDVKLDECHARRGGRIVLMDFGLGRETAARGRSSRRRSLSGTPLFMAPEVLAGAEPDVRSDVYSLGVVLFSLVTGSLPVDASSLADLRARHERGAMKHARDLRPDLPENFAPSARSHPLSRSAEPIRNAQRGRARARCAPSERRSRLGRRGLLRRARGRVRSLSRRLAAGLLVIAVVFGWRALSTRPVGGATAEAPFPDVPTLTLTGEHAGDMFGYAVVGVGDVDQDGFDDLLVGAPFAQGNVDSGGKAYLYRGTSDGLDPNPSWTLMGTVPLAYMGAAIASLTNLSFDGFGRHRGQRRRKRACHVFPGSKDGPAPEPAQILSNGELETLFGCTLATGDVDHDGDDDLLVGEAQFPSMSSPSGAGSSLPGRTAARSQRIPSGRARARTTRSSESPPTWAAT